jgi:AcrR family transcriptional regulator
MPTALVEAAARLLAEEGPAALTTRRLAAEVGTSTTVVYTCFGGMDDLVRAMVHEGFARLHALFGTVGESNDPVADIASLGHAYRENALANPHLYPVMFGGAPLAGFALTDEDRQYGRYTLDTLIAAVARAIAAGRFTPADPAQVAHQMWIALHGLATLDLGGYLVEPDAAGCFGQQLLLLMIAAGDAPDAAARSTAAVRR